MDSPAFAVNGMFSAVKVGHSSFSGNTVSVAKPSVESTPGVTMAVDQFQKQFQKFGKIGIDYTRPKKLSSYVRSGVSVQIAFPNNRSMAGHYSISNCGKTSGASKIFMKYDEYCAKGMLQTYKRSAIPYGVYTPKCTEGTQPFVAYDVRVFNRTQAFRQAQKPVNVRLREQYEARKKSVILAHNCSREESQFKNMPMSCATFLAGKMEALGACYRTVRPTSKEEDFMAESVRSQIYTSMNPKGVYGVGACEDGYSPGDADLRRVIALASEYRAAQQTPSTVTGQQYSSCNVARQLFVHECSYEETLVNQFPAVAAAMCRY